MSYLTNQFDLPFNSIPSTIMHIDLNSCFATIEQQANPKLRGKPIAVAAYASQNGCILAPSVEAKTFGVKTGTRVKDAKILCPHIIVLPPDPWKYRNIHLKLRTLIAQYTDVFSPKSIDEFVLDLTGMTCLSIGTHNVGREIKKRIKQEIGDWLMVSIGIAPNRFLAKTAAGLRKPDGLDEININNYLNIYKNLKLTDLCGIARQNALRLSNFGICSVLDFYNADIRKLKTSFHSVVGYDWYLRLRGWEIDDIPFGRRSYGNSYSLPKPFSTPRELAPILQKLVEKATFRLRRAGYKTRGVHVAISYRNGNSWHHGRVGSSYLFESREIFKEAFAILCLSPNKTPVRNMSISCFDIAKLKSSQLELFSNVVKKENLSKAVDKINERWGSFVITPARMIDTQKYAPDRIAFGNVKELEELFWSSHP